MTSVTLLARSSAKYIYLTAFFALLSGFFHPFTTGSSIEIVIIGIITLFAGLAGGILLYKAAIFERKQPAPPLETDQPPLETDQPPLETKSSGARLGLCLIGGPILIAVSLLYIYQLAGRI